MKKKKPEMYQTVTLYLSNGKKASYTGKYQISEKQRLSVVRVELTQPRPLPDGCKLEAIEEEEKNGH